MFIVIVGPLFAAALGAAFCFAGYRIFLVMLPIWGFFSGFWLGATGTQLIFGGGFLATTTGWVVGFILGLTIALLSYLFYLIGIAIIAGAFGAALGSGIMYTIGFEPGLIVGIAALCAAILLAILALALKLQKYIIIAITAAGGANALVLSVLLLIGSVTLEGLKTAGSAIQPVLSDSWFWLLIWLILAIIGFVLQYRANQTFTFDSDRFIEGWG